ncbi:MAG: ATP-binding cassette domain-containing protein [bacterium]|nr:ATP-binding cassette domain-containing protein [bacterium]
MVASLARLVRIFRDPRRDFLWPLGAGGAQFGILVAAGLIYTAVVSGGSGDRLVTTMLIDAIMVVGLHVYIGNTGVLSFGHIGFAAVAAYTFAVTAIDPARKSTVIRNAPWDLNEVHLSVPEATGVAVALTVIVALVVGIGLARSGARSGAVAATVITLALLFVTHEVAVNWPEVTGGDRAGLSFRIGHTLDSRWPVYGTLGAAIVVARLFGQSRIGRFARAAREDNLAARAMGINPAVQQMVALVLSVIIVAVAASLRVYEVGNLTPKFFFFEFTLLTLVMLIVGGRNSLTGSLAGVVVITAGRELARWLSTDGNELFGLNLDAPAVDWILREGLPTIFLGLAMLGFMIFRPNGLLGDFEIDNSLRRLISRRKPSEIPEPEVAGAAAPSVSQEMRGAEQILEVSNLTVDFGGFRALDGVSINASSNEVVGLIGPNGAGKTTLLNAITGVVESSAGRFSLAGVDLTRMPSHEIARLGLVRTFQNLRLFGSLTVGDNVEVASQVAEVHRHDRPRPGIDAVISAAGLWPYRLRRASELDYGNSRRLELARAVAAAPAFLLLDEPTSGMSETESLAMIDVVRRMAGMVGAGVIVIDHDLNFIVGICDRVYTLDQGTLIASGTPLEIQANPLVQAAYLGTEAAKRGDQS